MKSTYFSLRLAAAVGIAGWVALGFSCTSLYTPEDLVPKTVDQDSALPSLTITVHGRTRKIHVRTFGNPANPCLFIMPGSVSDIRAYQPFQSFSDAWYVVMWDQRGQGLSERVEKEELGYDWMVEEIHQLKEIFSPLQPVNVLGHSWSAVFAAMYTGAHPAEVARAVLLEPPGLQSSSMQASQSAVNLWTPGYLDMNWIANQGPSLSHAEIDFRTLAMLKSQVRDFYKDDNNLPEWPVWRVGGVALFTWEAGLLKNGVWDYDLTAGIDTFTGRVLLIGTDYSPIGAAFQRDYHLPLYKNAAVASVYTLPDSGHRMVTENWQDLEAAIRNFLEAP